MSAAGPIVRNDEVVGSIPTSSTNFHCKGSGISNLRLEWSGQAIASDLQSARVRILVS